MEGKHYDMIVEDDIVSDSYKDTMTYLSNTYDKYLRTNDDIITDSDSLTVSSDTGTWWEYTPDYNMPQQPVIISTPYVYPTPLKNNKKGDDDMRYLYEVILVNPKNDTFYVDKVVTRSEISASMEIYHRSQFDGKIEFDDLKTSCRILMEWKKEKSLKKAIETIKKAVE